MNNITKANQIIAVVIPSYRVKDKIEQVIHSIPHLVSHIIVVDDCCPEQSGKLAESLNNPRVTTLYHEKNLGVGGAVISGYKKALELGASIAVKIDGDGQMDASLIEKFIEPIIREQAHYTKGNRF